MGKSQQNPLLTLSDSANIDSSMMLNTAQQFDLWQEYFGHPKGNDLGILNNMFNLGSIASFFIV